MRRLLALILLVLTAFGGMGPAAAGCCPQMPQGAHDAAPAEGHHHGHGDAGDSFCAGHLCCAVALSRAAPASQRVASALSPRLLPEHLPSVPAEPLFRPPIAGLSR